MEQATTAVLVQSLVLELPCASSTAIKKKGGGLNRGFSSGRLSKRQDLFDESNMTVNVSGARHTLFCGFRWVFVLLVVVFFGGRASLCY